MSRNRRFRPTFEKMASPQPGPGVSTQEPVGREAPPSGVVWGASPSPERRALHGLPPGVQIAAGEMCWWCPCPSCGYGVTPLLPDAAGRLVPSPVGHCFGGGWRCSSRRIAECWQALCEGREIVPSESEKRLLADVIARDFLALWRGVRGRDPFRTLMAFACGLEERGVPPRLVAFAVRELARHRQWPLRSAEGVLRCVRS